VSLTNIPTGSTVIVSDDYTADTDTTVTADNGDLSTVSIDTRPSGVLTVQINPNIDAAVEIASTLTGMTIADASTITIQSAGGGSTNRLVQETGALTLDADDSTSLTLTGASNAGIKVGAVSSSTGLQVLKLNAAAGSASQVGTVADATSLATLEVTSTGSSSSATSGAIGSNGGSTNAPLTSLVATSASKSTTTLGAVYGSGSSSMTALTLTATGVSSKTYFDTISLGSSSLTTLTLTADVGATVGGGGGTVTTGTVTTGNITYDDRSTVSDGDGTGEATTFASAFTTLNLTVGESVTYTDTLAFSGSVATLVFSTDADSSAAMVWDSSNDIAFAGGSAVIIFGSSAGNVGVARVTQNATGTLNYDGTNVGTSRVTGNSGSDTLLGGTGGDTLTGGSGADTISGVGGNDSLTGGEGQDTIMGGTGNDAIVLTETTQAADLVKIANTASATDSGTVAGTSTSAADDVGADTISAFDTGYDTLELTIVMGDDTFNPSSHIAVSAPASSGTGTAGTVDAYAANVLLVNTNDNASTLTFSDATDMAINFSSLRANGVDLLGTTATDYLTTTDILGSIRYVITGSSSGDTITGGALSDTITGGAGADSIVAGAGNDVIVISAPATKDTVASGFSIGTSSTNLDRVAFDIAGFTSLKKVVTASAVSAIAATPQTGSTGSVVISVVDLSDNTANTVSTSSDLLVVGGASGAYSSATDSASEIETLLRATESIDLTSSTNFNGSFLIAYLTGNGTAATGLTFALATTGATGDTTASGSGAVTVTDILTIVGVTDVSGLDGVSSGNASGSDVYFINGGGA